MMHELLLIQVHIAIIREIVVVVVDLNAAIRDTRQSIESSYALVQMQHNVLARMIPLTVEEFRHFFGTLRESIAKTIGIGLLRFDVEFVLTLQVVEVANSQLENVCLLQLGDVLFAVALLYIFRVKFKTRRENENENKYKHSTSRRYITQRVGGS